MHSQKSSKHKYKSSKQKALMLTRNKHLLGNLVSTNKSSKQIINAQNFKHLLISIAKCIESNS